MLTENLVDVNQNMRTYRTNLRSMFVTGPVRALKLYPSYSSKTEKKIVEKLMALDRLTMERHNLV